MIKAFFKLIRWPNLMIIFLSMFFMLFLIIRPVLGTETAHFGMTGIQFALLVTATLFIAIGGYIINDIKDQDADAINKTGKNQVGVAFSTKQAAVIYLVFTLLGLFAGSYLSFLLQKTQYALIFLLTVGLLWYYAERYQCQPLVGNLVVAFLSALSFGLVWLFEIFAMQLQHISLPILPENIKMVNMLVLVYMSFAFLTSWLREMVKDIEDIDGDEKVGCLTFAVAHGRKRSKILALVVNLIGFSASILTQWFFYTHALMILFWLFMLVDGLFIFIFIQLLYAREKAQFGQLSLWIKLLMLSGIISMTFFYFEI